MEIRPDLWARAWVMQTRSRLTGASSFPVPTRQINSSPLTIPTRHGQISALIYRSPGGEVLAGDDRSRPPLHIQLHGGGMIGRAIREDEHVSRYIASESGCVVLALHFHTAPQVTYPVAEQECFDALHWAIKAGNQWGWDRHRITIGGGGTGAKLAINVAQQAHERNIKLAGLIASYPVTDFTRTDRPTPAEKPAINPKQLRFVADTYFPDPATRTEPLASPAFDLALVKKLPTTLIQVGTEDWLADDARSLATRLSKASRPYILTEYPADHGFIIHGDEKIMEAAIIEQVDFILNLYQ